MSSRLGERLKSERERLGLDQRKFAALGSVSKNTQIAYEQGSTSPSADYLTAIAENGADAVYILTGKRGMDSPAGSFLAEALEQFGGSLAAELDLVSIASIDLAYGMGGTFTDLPIDEQMMHFPRPWVESITHTPPAQLTWARGRGDSMSPTINDNDLVLFDRSQRQVREQDAIWALTAGDIGMIKRLRIRGDEVHILSDNERVPPDSAHPDEINIVGRVVFIGRRI